MNPAELSLCFIPEQDSSYLLGLLKDSSDPALSKLQVDIHPMLWEDYKQEVISMALHNRGSDVSQVGFPLTDDLISMNALLPIPPQLIAKIGGEGAFHPTIWNIASRHKESRLWALPWLVDPRAIFYWKDMVDKAGLDAAVAFQTAESMEDACRRIKGEGIESPWVLGMADRFVIIHSIVSWVWGKGGDFISPDGKRAIFLEKDALDGMEAYFRLGQYMPANSHTLTATDAQRIFTERKAALTLGPYGSLKSFLAAVPADKRELLGVVLPPGPPLVAGSDLVLWRHSRKPDEVAQLISVLFSNEVQIKYAAYLGHLPVTKEALEQIATNGDQNTHTFIETLNKGRLFTATKFAGMLEAQLSAGLAGLWANLAQHPSENIRDVIQNALQPLRRRFETLQES